MDGPLKPCIRFPKSPIFECEHDFGGWIVDPQNQIQSGTFRHIAEGMMALYCCRICLQTFTFWTRRSAVLSSADPTDQVPLLTIVYNGIFHGVFILISQYPLDLPNLLTGRWSILQQRPHWTNGLLQIVVLAEKTMMGYLILELTSSDPLDCTTGYNNPGSDVATNMASLCEGNPMILVLYLN